MHPQRTQANLGWLYILVFCTLAGPHAATSAPLSDAPWVGDTMWGTLCRGNKQGYGPFDYTLRNQYIKELKIVEDYHFSPMVENLIEGDTTSNPLGDLDYTLMAWPNHHRALNTVIRARVQKKENFKISRFTPAECYLQRAINFSPDDGVSYMLYGMLLHQMGDLKDALERYQSAERLSPQDLQTKYNIGLLLVDLERYDEAKKYAVDVYRNSFPLPGLKKKLRKEGYWSD